MSNGLVDVGKYITLIMRNQRAEPVVLEEGDIIGYLQLAKLMEVPQPVEPRVAAVQDAWKRRLVRGRLPAEAGEM